MTTGRLKEWTGSRLVTHSSTGLFASAYSRLSSSLLAAEWWATFRGGPGLKYRDLLLCPHTYCYGSSLGITELRGGLSKTMAGEEVRQFTVADLHIIVKALKLYQAHARELRYHPMYKHLMPAEYFLEFKDVEEHTGALLAEFTVALGTKDYEQRAANVERENYNSGRRGKTSRRNGPASE